MSHKRKISVIGLGYVGLPAAAAFARSAVPVVGYDIDPDTAAAAEAAGFTVAPSDADAVRGADLVILAMPLPGVADAVLGSQDGAPGAHHGAEPVRASR